MMVIAMFLRKSSAGKQHCGECRESCKLSNSIHRFYLHPLLDAGLAPLPLTAHKTVRCGFWLESGSPILSYGLTENSASEETSFDRRRRTYRRSGETPLPLPPPRSNSPNPELTFTGTCHGWETSGSKPLPWLVTHCSRCSLLVAETQTRLCLAKSQPCSKPPDHDESVWPILYGLIVKGGLPSFPSLIRRQYNQFSVQGAPSMTAPGLGKPQTSGLTVVLAHCSLLVAHCCKPRPPFVFISAIHHRV